MIRCSGTVSLFACFFFCDRCFCDRDPRVLLLTFYLGSSVNYGSFLNRSLLKGLPCYA